MILIPTSLRKLKLWNQKFYEFLSTTILWYTWFLFSCYYVSLVSHQFSSVPQSCGLFATPWIAARQASLSITNSQSSLRLMSIESVMPSSHLILSVLSILLAKVLVTWSHPILCDPTDYSLPGSSVHGIKNSPAKNTGVDCHSLLQGIFLTQGENPGLLHCRQILYHLNHQGSTLISHQMWSLFPITGHSTKKKNLLSLWYNHFLSSWIFP